jgi:hypothetical protein
VGEKQRDVLLVLRDRNMVDGAARYDSEHPPEEGDLVDVLYRRLTVRARVTRVFPDGKLGATEIPTGQQYPVDEPLPTVTSRLNRVQVDVAGEVVAISWEDRNELLAKLRTVVGSEAIVDKFAKAAPNMQRVELDPKQRLDLRVILELWGVTALPDGLAHLLVALVRADPGGHVGTTSVMDG